MRKTDRKSVPLPKSGEWFSLSYTALLFRRMAAPTLLLLAILILAWPVGLLIAFSSASDFYPVAAILQNTVGSLKTALPLVCALVGVVGGAVVQKELLSPRSASFLHSLPYRRECHLLCRYAAGWMVALTGLAGSLLLAMLVALLFGLGGSAVLLLTILPPCLLCFLAFYTLSFFCGTLTGRSFVQILLTLVIAFLPIALYELHLLWIDQCTRGFYMSFYESEALIFKAFPFCRLLTYIAGKAVTAADYIGWPIASVVMLALSLLFGRLRDDTRCGDPMVFRPAELILLYTAVLFAAQIARMVFSNIASFSMNILEIFWTGFGILAISLLTFLICNSFLRRSWRESFRHIGGWCVFAVLFLATTSLIAGSVFSPLGILSDPKKLTEATIIHGNEQYDYRDAADLEAFCAVVRECEDYGRPLTITDYDIGNDVTLGIQSSYYTVYVTGRTRAGFAFGRILNLSSKENVADALRTLADSPVTAHAVNVWLDAPGLSPEWSDAVTAGDSFDPRDIPDGSLRTDPVGAAYFDRTYLGSLYLYRKQDRETFAKALFYGDLLTETVSRNDLLSPDTLDDFCGIIDRLLILDTATGKYADFDKTADLREILPSLVKFTEGDDPLFSIPDERFVVMIDSETIDRGTIQTAFRSGHIPACVTAQFGE